MNYTIYGIGSAVTLEEHRRWLENSRPAEQQGGVSQQAASQPQNDSYAG